MKETKRNIITSKIERYATDLDPVIQNIIQQCLEPDPKKRLTPSQLLDFLDNLEMQKYGRKISLEAWNSLRASADPDALKLKVMADVSTDYSKTTLGLRNNPWFFSKAYSH